MNILIYEWNSFTYTDIVQAISKRGFNNNTVYAKYERGGSNEKAIELLYDALSNGAYDVVFSVNYFSFVARLCKELGKRYVSWCYDNPLDVNDLEETMGFETNRIYLYDRVQTQMYKDKGYENVFHLPLAVNCNRLSKIIISEEEEEKYYSQISFVGNLYKSQLPLFMSAMEDYYKGYIDGVCKAQIDLYGIYLIDNAITEDMIDSINGYYEQVLKNTPNSEFRINKRAVSYAMASDVTRKERVLLINMLSKRFGFKLYSSDNNTLLKDVNHMGCCDYMTEMPKVFRMTDINLNISLKAIQSGIPQRILDILGCGGFVMTNYQPELLDYFSMDESIVIYESFSDACDKAEYYLKHPDARIAIAKRGHEIVENAFNYDDRIKVLFDNL